VGGNIIPNDSRCRLFLPGEGIPGRGYRRVGDQAGRANKQRTADFDRNIGRRMLFSPILAKSGMERQMTQTARDIIVVGLRNAHAMEIQARELMERQSERLDDYPEVKAKVAAHLQETNQQLKRLEQCLEACGESTSSLKDTVQSVAANAMAMAHSMAGDEILKNTFANNAFEHFEIAAYKSLLTLCPAAGMESARAPLETSLKEEERMAAWIDANVAKVTMEYVRHEQQAA
jgi:ferritin-like metal-binding protein YciE